MSCTSSKSPPHPIHTYIYVYIYIYIYTHTYIQVRYPLSKTITRADSWYLYMPAYNILRGSTEGMPAAPRHERHNLWKSRAKTRAGGSHSLNLDLLNRYAQEVHPGLWLPGATHLAHIHCPDAYSSPFPAPMCQLS